MSGPSTGIAKRPHRPALSHTRGQLRPSTENFSLTVAVLCGRPAGGHSCPVLSSSSGRRLCFGFLFVCVWVCVHVCECVCVRVYMCAHAHVCMCLLFAILYLVLIPEHVLYFFLYKKRDACVYRDICMMYCSPHARPQKLSCRRRSTRHPS